RDRGDRGSAARSAGVSELDGKVRGALLHARIARLATRAPKLAQHGRAQTSVDQFARLAERRIIERRDDIADQVRVPAQRGSQPKRLIIFAQSIDTPVLAEICVAKEQG